MALVKCKECGEQVSTTAKTCPKCGAKAPKKTSVFTWLVLFFILFIIYVCSQSPTSNNYNSPKSKVNSSSNTQKTVVSKKVAQPKPSWTSSTSRDEMTGKLSAYASSPVSLPTKRMSFPYGDVHAWLGVGCDGTNEWAYIGFNTSPNLTNDETEDGYNLLHTRMKWDNEIETVILTQDWGAKFLHFRYDSSAIEKMAASSSALLELQWHGEQKTYFEFSLNGSSKALSEIRAECSK